MCYFGLSQKAVIVQYYESLSLQDANKSNEQEDSKSTTTSKVSPSVENKYQRSALDSEQSNRIASKIEMAIKTEQLYLDSQLTLHKLANHLAISANYISQTLNETLSTNFFDYVNKWRIEAAKELVIENNKTIEEIADSVGFNARSSFYKAFKLYTGITPGAYRKQAANKGANS